MKDGIVDVDIIWPTEGSLELNFYRIAEVHSPIYPFITGQYLFDKSGILYGLDEEDMFGSTLWFGITELDSERIKEVNLLGLKYNIIDGDILWST